jgi:hypothetical protein
LVEAEKSLDLLQGLLVYSAWSYYYICKNPIISTTIHMAISLASDLGLTKRVHLETLGAMLHFSAQGCPKAQNCVLNRQRTVEERRAIVGLFLISSV